MNKIYLIIALMLFSLGAICQRKYDIKYVKTEEPNKLIRIRTEKRLSDQELVKVAESDPRKLKKDELIYVAGLSQDSLFKQKIYEKALQSHPKDWKILNNAALINIDKGEYEAALQLLLKADSIDPDNGTVQNNIGVVYALKKELNNSKLYFDKSARLGVNENRNLLKLESAKSGISVNKNQLLIITAEQTSPKATVLLDTVVQKQDGTITPKSFNIEGFANNIKGRVRYKIDTTMQVNSTYNVNLTISKNLPMDSIVKLFPEFKSGNIADVMISIGARMKCKLIDPNRGNFRISNSTDSVQPVSIEDMSYTQWQWQVTPLKPGKNALTLNIDVYIGEDKKSVKVFNGIINVTVPPQPWYTAFFSFISREWDKIISFISVIVIPLLGWVNREKIFKFFRKNRSKD
jgi:hypothetical protein